MIRVQSTDVFGASFGSLLSQLCMTTLQSFGRKISGYLRTGAVDLIRERLSVHRTARAFAACSPVSGFRIVLDWKSCASTAAIIALLLLISAIVSPNSAFAQRLDGFNVVAAPNHPFGSLTAGRALTAARHLGATTVAIIPFLWQEAPSSPNVSAGGDMSDQTLRVAIGQVHRLGFFAVVKPHIWVPGSWAGAVEPDSEKAWQTWFMRYRDQLVRIARIAAQEGAEALAIGTELTKTSQRPEWPALIAAVRAVFPGMLYYIAHNVDEAEIVPFWPMLDAIGVSLYPPLGVDDDRTGRLKAMKLVADRLDALSSRQGKVILIGEIGLRSARGAAAKPWESAEERTAAVDAQLQADVLADWLAVLNRPSIHGVLIWRWFTDPSAGGPNDTDFTVQGKPAESILSCAWSGICLRP